MGDEDTETLVSDDTVRRLAASGRRNDWELDAGNVWMEGLCIHRFIYV